MKVNKPSQAIGVISTPNAGGMTPRTARNSGSVGMTNSTQGKSVDLVVGYQDKTTRANMANDMIFKKGSRKAAVGLTHGSVSAIIMEVSMAEATCTSSEGSTMAERDAEGRVDGLPMGQKAAVQLIQTRKKQSAFLTCPNIVLRNI